MKNIFTILFFVLFIFTLNSSFRKFEHSYENKVKLGLISKNDFLYQCKQYLQKKGIKHANIAIAQIILETDNLKSRKFKEYNNLFGMKNAYFRKQVKIGVGRNGQVIYKDFNQCLDDYILWCEYNIKNSKNALYYIGKNYSTDRNYYKKLIQILKKNKLILY